MHLSADEYGGHDGQYRLFLDVARRICADLGINFKNYIKRNESTRGSTYCVRIEDKCILEFTFDTIVKENKIQKVTAEIDIEYDNGDAPFEDFDDITKHVCEDNYLARWAAKTIHKFNLEHHPIDLNTSFGKRYIRVYGIPSDPLLSFREMNLLLNGAQCTMATKISGYKLRHVDGFMTRTYSYCFFINSGHLPGFWAFFLNMCGEDSSGRRRSLEMIEHLIAKLGDRVELQNADVEYKKLHRFLSENVTTFNPGKTDTISFYLRRFCNDFGGDFSESYSNSLKRYDNKEYSEALRSLRALVQMAMTAVCEKGKIQIPEKPSIHKLLDLLIRKNVLDGEKRAWYCAFTSAANLAAHGKLPTESNLSDQDVESRIAILLGTHLINELESTIGYVDDD